MKKFRNGPCACPVRAPLGSGLALPLIRPVGKHCRGGAEVELMRTRLRRCRATKYKLAAAHGQARRQRFGIVCADMER